MAARALRRAAENRRSLPVGDRFGRQAAGAHLHEGVGHLVHGRLTIGGKRQPMCQFCFQRLHLRWQRTRFLVHQQGHPPSVGHCRFRQPCRRQYQPVQHPGVRRRAVRCVFLRHVVPWQRRRRIKAGVVDQARKQSSQRSGNGRHDAGPPLHNIFPTVTRARYCSLPRASTFQISSTVSPRMP